MESNWASLDAPSEEDQKIQSERTQRNSWLKLCCLCCKRSSTRHNSWRNCKVIWTLLQRNEVIEFAIRLLIIRSNEINIYPQSCLILYLTWHLMTLITQWHDYAAIKFIFLCSLTLFRFLHTTEQPIILSGAVHICSIITDLYRISTAAAAIVCLEASSRL